MTALDKGRTGIYFTLGSIRKEISDPGFIPSRSLSLLLRWCAIGTFIDYAFVTALRPPFALEKGFVVLPFGVVMVVAFIVAHHLFFAWRGKTLPPATVENLLVVAMQTDAVRRFHGTDANLAPLVEVKHGLWVRALFLISEPVARYSYPGPFLVLNRGLPWLVYVLGV